MHLVSPLKVPKTKDISRAKKAKQFFILNLNGFRNTHYLTLNTTKKNYKTIMQSQIDLMPSYTDPIMILYILYPKTRRLTDVGNVVSIHKKYLEDALVESGKLIDDNYNYIVGSLEKFGEVDKDNPRVEVHIITDIYAPITLFFKE